MQLLFAFLVIFVINLLRNLNTIWIFNSFLEKCVHIFHTLGVKDYPWTQILIKENSTMYILALYLLIFKILASIHTCTHTQTHLWVLKYSTDEYNLQLFCSDRWPKRRLYDGWASTSDFDISFLPWYQYIQIMKYLWMQIFF